MRKRILLFLMLTVLLAGTSFALSSVQAETPSLTTGFEMSQNPQKLLPVFNHSGVERLAVDGNGIISCWEDGSFYYQDDVYGVDINMKFTAGSQVSFALRASGGGTMWVSAGYYAFIDGTTAQIYKVTNPSSWNTNMIASGSLSANIFDGMTHNIKFSALENSEGKIVLSFSTDSGTPISGTDAGEAFAITGTEFKINTVNPPNVQFTVIPDMPVEENQPIYITSEKMYSDKDNLLPDYGYQGDFKITAENYVIYSNEEKLYYKAETQGLDIRLKVTSGTALSMGLRATAAGSVWSGTKGYFAVVQGTNVELYKIDGQGDWNDEKLTSGTVKNIFDGSEHRIKLSAVENTAGFVVVSFSVDGEEAVKATETTAALPIEETEAVIMGLTPDLSFQIRALSPDPVEVTADDMFASLFNGLGSGAGKLSAVNGVVSADTNGKMVYPNSADIVSGAIKTEGATGLFMVLRATKDTAIWDGGMGYFVMLEKSGEMMSARLFKGIKQEANGDFIELIGATVSQSLFTGNKEDFEFSAVNNVLSQAVITFKVNGQEIFSYTDSSPLETENTHFMIIPTGATASYKLYGKDGADFDFSQASYKTVTSKTMLKYINSWLLDGAVITEQGTIKVLRDQSIVMFDRVLENGMYSIDLDILSLPDSGWLAVTLNANKQDALWNSGFRSNVVFIRKSNIGIAYWSPETNYVSTIAHNTNLEEGIINLKVGMYELSDLNTGKAFTFIKVLINDIEIANVPVADAYNAQGMFGLINYGSVSYEILSTENEIDTIPSSTDGTQENRENESAITNTANADNWAIIANSFNPGYNLDGGYMNACNNGYVTYANSVNFSKLSFDIRFNNEIGALGQYAQFFFSKNRQDSFIGMPLEAVTTNYGYGIKILPEGIISVLKTNTNTGLSTLMTYDYTGETGNDFINGFNNITIYREIVCSGLKISVFVNDEIIGYSVIDTDYYSANYPMDGFVSFSNSKTGTSISVDNFKFMGTEGNQSATLAADAVNFVTYFENDGVPYVYFCFDSASYTTKWVEIYGTDIHGNYTEHFGTVYAPSDTFALPTDYNGKTVKVVSVGFTPSGNKECILELSDLENYYSIKNESAERIAIKSDENGAYFIFADSGKEYMPIGANYMSLRGGDHSTFDAATSFTDADYNPIKSEAALRALAANGGNVTRVFAIGRTSTNPGISGDASIPVSNTEYYYEGLYIPYMENLVHYLRTSMKYGIYTMISLGDGELPSNSYYFDLQGGVALATNYMKLTTQGVNARKKYVENFVKYFKENAPDVLSAIFSLSFQNEYAVYANIWPFNLTSGTVTLANGKNYDMGVTDDRQAAFEEGTIYYLNQMTEAAKSIDANLLCSEGTYTLNIVNNMSVYGMQNITSGDYRMPATLDIYLSSDIDFVDMHIYLANRNDNTVLSSFTADLQSMKFLTQTTQLLLKDKPIFMGEFGPSTRYANAEQAVNIWTETVRLAKESGFKGFAVWTLDSHIQKEWWNILAFDGSFDTFRELGRTMSGNTVITGITASNAVGKTGESISIEVKGIQDGDVVMYRTGESGIYSRTNPIFDQQGTYTVYYRVLRSFMDDFNGVATVTINEEGKLPEITGITAEDVLGKTGEECSVTVNGLLEGDVLLYKTSITGEYIAENPVFTEAGTYTVYYKVQRLGYAEYEGTAAVTVSAQSRSCKGSMNSAMIAVVAMLAVTAAAMKNFKKAV